MRALVVAAMPSTLLITSLPVETLLLICSHLDAEELQAVGTVCRKLREVATGDE